jgi:thioredoxin 1
MNKSEFQQNISQTGKPVVVDFWAPWCAPCRATKPILEKLANEYAGRVDFIPINADDSHDLVQQLGILGIPTVLIFQNGIETSRITGAQNETNYKLLFDSVAKGKEVKVPLLAFDRMLRLGAGALLVLVGISTSSWPAAGIGFILAFLGIYDRCPIWRALTGMLQRKFGSTIFSGKKG